MNNNEYKSESIFMDEHIHVIVFDLNHIISYYGLVLKMLAHVM